MRGSTSTFAASVFGAIAAVSLNAGIAVAEDPVLCEERGGPREITLEFNSFQQLGYSFDCIIGDFVADMTPCAPDGMYSLSAPTGSADVVGVVSRWQDYLDHSGGVVSHFITPSKIGFSGGFVWDGSGYDEQWNFVASRLNGRGVLTVGEDVTEFACHRAEQAF